MLQRFLLNWLLLAVAFAITDWLLDGLDVKGGVVGFLIVAAIFGVVNAILGTILRILTLPLTILTLGLFALVINALMLVLTDAITDRLEVDDFFWTAILAAVVMAIASVVLNVVARRVVD